MFWNSETLEKKFLCRVMVLKDFAHVKPVLLLLAVYQKRCAFCSNAPHVSIFG